MRAIVLALITSVLALPLAGQSGPAVYPTAVTMRVGETAVLHGYQHPGFSTGFPYHYEFSSDEPSIATVHGFASGMSLTKPDPIAGNGVVFVTAVREGIAHVIPQTVRLTLSTITVLAPILPVEIRAKATRVLRGQQVVLTAVVPGYDGTPVFAWYRGRMGDMTRRIQASLEPTLTFTGSDLGVSYVWVQALAGAIASSDEISIEVIQPRSRSVRH